MSALNYDPTEYGSPEEAARSIANMEQEFGMPSKLHPNSEVGRMVNELHFRHQAAMNDEFGWYGTTREELRRRWGLT